MVLNKMIKSLPLYERKSKIFIEIFDAEAKEFNLLDDHLNDIRKQLIVDTATWGLNIYEKELKIVSPSDSTLDGRRLAIKTKWRSGTKVDRVMLEAVASAIFRAVVKVEFDGHIIFSLISDEHSEVRDFGLFEKTINEIKPAHLAMKIVIKHISDLSLFAGGIINEWKRTTLEPIQFEMPNIKFEQNTIGYISTWNKHTINPEVKHKWLITRVLY